MAGKYAHIINQLPRLLGTEPQYQEKVDVVKLATLKDLDGQVHASILATGYESLRGDTQTVQLEARDVVEDLINRYGKEGLEALLSEVNLRIEAQTQLLVEQFEVECVTSLKLASGRSVGVQYEPYAQVKDKEAFRRWCIKSGLERSLMLPWMTTNAITKERLLAGEPEPDGVTAHAKTKIVMRKA